MRGKTRDASEPALTPGPSPRWRGEERYGRLAAARVMHPTAGCRRRAATYMGMPVIWPSNASMSRTQPWVTLIERRGRNSV